MHCVFFLYFVHILWYFSPHKKNMKKPQRLPKAHSCCFNVFCFLSFPSWCNVIMSNYGSKCRCKIYYFPFFLFWISFAIYFIISSFLPNSILLKQSCMKSPSSLSDNLWIFLSHSWHWKACQNGFAQHLEHLLFYGADTSSLNASGNTALHISALYNKASTEIDPSSETIITIITTLSFLKVLTDQFPSLNDQESCVRVLLYRGANKEAKNKHGQTPFQVNGQLLLYVFCFF